MIILLEVFVFFIMSFLSAAVVTQLIISYGIKFLGSPITYVVPLINIAIVLCLSLVILFSTALIFFNKFNKKSVIKQTQDTQDELKQTLLFDGFISLTTIGLYFILNLHVVKTILGIFAAPFQIILILLFLLTCGSFLIKILTKGLNIKKKPFIFMLHLKVLLTKKAFYQYLSVLLISSLSIFLLILANDYMNIRQNDYQNQYNLDFVVANILNDYDQIYEEIRNIPEVSATSKVGLFHDVSLIDKEDAIRDLVSMNPHDIDDFFNLDIDSLSYASLESNTLTILLPLRYQKLYDKEIGDTIEFYLSSEFPNVSFVIGGFFEKQLGNLAFTNISFLDEYQSLEPNTIFVNAADQPNVLKDLLLDAYSSQLIYVIDYKATVELLSSEMVKATQYLNMIIIVILLCFVLSIINHSALLLSQMKSLYGKLYVLGYTHKKMVLLQVYESLIFIFVILFVTLISYILIAQKLESFIIFFGEYESVRLTQSSLVLGTIFVVILFTITKSVYIIKTKSIQIQDVLKIY